MQVPLAETARFHAVNQLPLASHDYNGTATDRVSAPVRLIPELKFVQNAQRIF